MNLTSALRQLDHAETTELGGLRGVARREPAVRDRLESSVCAIQNEESNTLVRPFSSVGWQRPQQAVTSFRMLDRAWKQTVVPDLRQPTPYDIGSRAILAPIH